MIDSKSPSNFPDNTPLEHPDSTVSPADIETIFVVDNDPAVCTFMTMFLEKRGYDVSSAEDGLQALSALEGKCPDVIFIDLVMPLISGEKLCQILRSQRRFDNTYCIVLSAISSEEEIDYSSYGFDACIAKGPLKKLGVTIVEVLAKLGDEITFDVPGGVYGFENLYRREITRELLSTKHHFELILENMAESILETSQDGRIVFANPAAVNLLGVREADLLSVDLGSLFDLTQRDAVSEMLKSADGQKQAEPGLVRYGGRCLWMQVHQVSDELQSSFVIIIEDVTERREAEDVLRRSHEDLERRVYERTEELAKANISLRGEINHREALENQLRASLREKDVLLDEIHHRVKNNLQIISSMLGLKANRIKNNELRTVVADMQSRIQSLSLVHEKLYRSENFAEVDIGDYFGSLVNSLVGTYTDQDREITVHVDTDEIQLSIDVAVPCALIVNELITNSLKYAFVGKQTGAVRVVMRVCDKTSYRLEVSDDGVGIPDDAALESGNTLGFRIVKVLTGQIGGTLRVGRKQGTKFILDIPVEQQLPSEEAEENHGE